MYKLKKTLYDLKQAQRAMYVRIDGYFHQYSVTRIKSVPTLYIMNKGQEILLVYLYVVDMIYMGICMELNYDFKTSMMQ